VAEGPKVVEFFSSMPRPCAVLWGRDVVVLVGAFVELHVVVALRDHQVQVGV
jgi:hypothetical protein